MIEQITHSERVAILAPTGRDSAVAAAILREAGFCADVCGDLSGLSTSVVGSVGLAIIADEALLNANLRPFVEVLAGQEPWSDFPIILLTRRGGGPEKTRRPFGWRICSAT